MTRTFRLTKWSRCDAADWRIPITLAILSAFLSLTQGSLERILRAAEPIGNVTAPVRLKLELGENQVSATEQRATHFAGGQSLSQGGVSIQLRVVPDVASTASPLSESVTPESEGEIWVAEEPSAEIWVETSDQKVSAPSAAESPESLASNPHPQPLSVKPETQVSPAVPRIILGSQGVASPVVMRVRSARGSVILQEASTQQTAASGSTTAELEPVGVQLPPTSPPLLRSHRESLELNQSWTALAIRPAYQTSSHEVPWLFSRAEVAPEPESLTRQSSAGEASQLTSRPVAEAQTPVVLTSNQEASPAEEIAVRDRGTTVPVAWEWPGRVSSPREASPASDRTEMRITQTEVANVAANLNAPTRPIPSTQPVTADWQTPPAHLPATETPLIAQRPGAPAPGDTVQSQPQSQREADKTVVIQPEVVGSGTPRNQGSSSVKINQYESGATRTSATFTGMQAESPQVSSAPLTPAPISVNGNGQSPFEVIDESGELTVVVRRSKLLRTQVDVYRTAVVDSSICDIVQFTPREISILGKSQGATHVTFWFQDERYRPMTYLVRVTPDPEVEKSQVERYELLESHLAKLFPESKVDLIVVGDKLIVKGQARDAAEAAQIMAVIRGELVRARGVVEGQAADPLGREATGQALPAIQVINMLRIPGPPQVALKVKIAELNRTAARNFGVDMYLNFDQGKFLIQSLLNISSGGTASVLGNFDGGDLQFGLHYLEEHGVVRLLSEPTLVTISGRPATFIAGGEFAVPTAVGVDGVGAVTTDFRAYGAIITFLPTVLDKDLIRLEVAPEFSQIDKKNAVNGTPGLRTRAVTTTVEMREGQTLAIAGLLDDSMTGNNQGDLPIFNQIFGRRSMTRNETELIILVTPEIVHPMEPEEVPPLPGFDVTEPTNHEFYIKGHLEGRPTQEYDSTTWPRLRRRYNAGGPARISGPYGHGN